MKTIKRELVHVGMFGSDGTVVTKQDLADINETFDGKGPVTLGHKLVDWMPKFGNTTNVDLNASGESLAGKLEINDVLADAVDEKFYEDISIGMKRRASDGKRYLHHVAFLGAVPPKIRDLKTFSDLGIEFCGDDEGVVLFSDAQQAPAPDPAAPSDTPQDIADALRRIADKGRAGWAFEDVTKALAELTSIATEMLVNGAKIPDSLKDPMQNFADQLLKNKATGEAGKEEDVEAKEENERLKKELADSKAANLVTAKEGLKTAMEGRIPKAQQGLVLELADRLQDVDTIELADSESGTKEKVSGLEVLRRVLASIPKPVVEGRMNLGDGDEKPDGKPAVRISFDKA
jgi:hypothetical protein